MAAVGNRVMEFFVEGTGAIAAFREHEQAADDAQDRTHGVDDRQEAEGGREPGEGREGRSGRRWRLIIRRVGFIDGGDCGDGAGPTRWRQAEVALAPAPPAIVRILTEEVIRVFGSNISDVPWFFRSTTVSPSP